MLPVRLFKDYVLFVVQVTVKADTNYAIIYLGTHCTISLKMFLVAAPITHRFSFCFLIQSQLMKEKNKYQRIVSKKNQEFKNLVAEVRFI